MEEDELERDRVGLRVLGIFVLYLVVGLLPAVLSGAGTAGRLVVEEQLASGDRLVPAFDHGGLAVGLGLVVSWVLAPLVTLAAGWRLVHDRTVRVLLAVVVLLMHSAVVCGGLAVSGTSLWSWVSEGRLTDRLRSPEGEQRAFLYRTESGGSCGWEVYVAQDLEPVSHQQLIVPCDCEQIPPAVLAWDAGQAVLQDPGGLPYTCPPPPSTCDTFGKGAGWLVVGTALLLTRRRRRSTARRGARGLAARPS